MGEYDQVDLHGVHTLLGQGLRVQILKLNKFSFLTYLNLLDLLLCQGLQDFKGDISILDQKSPASFAFAAQ